MFTPSKAFYYNDNDNFIEKNARKIRNYRRVFYFNFKKCTNNRQFYVFVMNNNLLKVVSILFNFFPVFETVSFLNQKARLFNLCTRSMVKVGIISIRF